MKLVFEILVALLVAVLPLSNAWAGRCGPFEIFEGNDYCVKCQSSKAEKVYACPGGEVGLVSVGVSRPNCSVSYYSPACESASVVTNVMDSKKARDRENAKHNSAKAGRPAITKEGGVVVIRMTQEDFDKLVKSK